VSSFVKLSQNSVFGASFFAYTCKSSENKIECNAVFAVFYLG